MPHTTADSLAGLPGHEISPARRDAAQAVLDALESARGVILTTHLNADGDGTGCQAALMGLVESMGGEAWIVNPSPYPRQFRFLLTDPEQARVLEAGSEDARRRCLEADLCVVVDTGETDRIGRVNPLVSHLPKVIIDHHPPGERAIEGLSFVDPTAAAAGELVFDLVSLAGGPWSPTVVRGLYVAILTDTGSFRFSNSTSRVHRVAARLIELGASPDELYREVYGSFPLRRFRLLERALATLTVAHDGRVAWITVPPDAYRELGCEPADLEGMVDIPREVEGVEVALMFRELGDGATKISFRSNGPADVNDLARRFGGGGHIRAAGALVDGPLPEVVGRVVAAAGDVLDSPPDGSESRDGSRVGEP